ncbi:MAG: hypothetical protein RIQ53_561 [Pseudomonadota bacterium]|jgi:hypothetical protein
MATIQISYDLNAPGRDYTKLIARIKELAPNWCRPLESYWLIKINSTPAEVRNDLQRYVDQSTKLLVLDVTGDSAAWSGMETDVAEWIKANL